VLPSPRNPRIKSGEGEGSRTARNRRSRGFNTSQVLLG
jgi:hypothetical protein